MLPLPQALWERGVRRYGFHGLSYEYMSVALAERHGDAARGRTIVAHLGSGASLCAMRELRSVATTMGFSALEGLMMGTRCGSLDPGVLLYLLEVEKLGLNELTRLLYRESGLLGVSGLSPSPQVLLEAEPRNPRARAALELWVRRVVREIGALTAALGGLDMLAFTAGIGEHSAVLRERICAALGWLGLELDPGANGANASTISRAGSRVRVAVEPTNEEWIAASHAVHVLSSEISHAA
jgi:acetate kinase